MAGTLTVTHFSRSSNGNDIRSADTTVPKTLTLTGTLVYDQVHTITTSEVSITSFGGISAANQGYYEVWNLDSTNYVDMGIATTVYSDRIYANGPPKTGCMYPSVDWYLKANSASVNVRIKVYEV